MKNYFAGLDIGSAYTKALLLDERKSLIATFLCPTKSDMAYSAGIALSEVMAKAGIGREAVFVTTTGYGKRLVCDADLQENDILCLGYAAGHINKDIRTIIEVGGQDAKVVRIDERGMLLDFVMNDRCSAGTGQFLEVIAQTLGIALEDFPELSLQSTKEIRLSSTCTVFAQTEIISFIAAQTKKEDIINAVQKSIALRIRELALEIETEDIVCFAGGLACNKAIKEELRRSMAKKLFVPNQSQFFAAYGAALKGIDAIKANNV